MTTFCIPVAAPAAPAEPDPQGLGVFPPGLRCRHG